MNSMQQTAIRKKSFRRNAAERKGTMKIYLYGMICGSNSFRLNEFPKPDEYSEIQQYARFIGGETGTCATVLSSLGAEVRIERACQ